MNYRLPFVKIIAAAVFFAWASRAEFLKAISVPTLVLAVVWGIWLSFSAELPPYFSWVILLGYGLGFSFLAVTCHRLILVDAIDRSRPFKAKPGYRELRFLAWVIVIYAIESLLEFPAQFLAQYVSGGVASEGGWIADWTGELASMPALYVLARLSLAFPAAAIDKSSSLRWSWARTRGNGWRIFAVAGLFPWLTGMAISLMWREDATVLEQVVLSIVAYVGLAIEVVALSFAYKELAKHYADSAPLPAGETGTTPMEASLESFHDLAQHGKGGKLYLAVRVAVGLGIGYLLIGSLSSLFVDCTGELISSATSPGGAYRAELLNQTCKDDRNQGLILNIVQTASPRRMYGYPLSRTFANEVDLAWTSDRRLVVRHAGSLDLADAPAMHDDIQIVLEKKPGPD